MAGNLTAMIAAAFSGSAAPPVTSDPYFDYTTLLLPGNGTNGAQNNTFLDSSTNNFPITRNGNTTQGTFSPFSQTGWGNYFDGTGDYINTVDNAALDVGSSAFTFEFWFFNQQNAQSGSFAGIGLIASKSDYNGSNSNGWSLYCYDGSNLTTPSSKLTFFANGTSYAATTSDGAAPFNTWTHIAVVKNGTNLTIYSNGVAVVTSTSAPSTINDTSTGFYIGSTVNGVTWNNTFPSRGYISNARLVKGVAVYTGAFTPPTSPLEATQSAGTNISAITGTQTSLLTCQSNRFIDNSSNNFTITRNGDTSVVAFSPFNPSASWSAATNGGSGYFDGAGDYIFISANSAFQFNGDFTVECWFYSGSGTTTSKYDQIVGTIESSATGYWRLGSEFNGGKQLWFTWTNGSYNDINTSFSVSDNSWHHLAVSRISNSVRLFVDGVQKGSTTTVTTALTASAPLMVMNSTQGANQTQGYVSSLRIIKGQGLYSGTFTPPVTPFTTSSVGSTGAGAAGSITGTVGVLLNFTNAGIYDATSKNDLETVGNAQISTTQSKWGGSSMAFDGTGDYLYQAPTPFIRLGTGDFTCECWVRFNVVTGTQGIFQLADSYLQSSLSNNGVGLSTTSGTGWLFFAKNSQTFTYSPIVPAAANTWMHVALVRYSGTTKLYVNGTGDAALTASSDTTNYTATYLALGGVYGGNSLNGYIQDFRITVGVARYTANFTPPTAAFPTL